MVVMISCCFQMQIPLEVAPPLDLEKLKGLKLGLAGEHQYINAGLAVSLCKCWLQRTGYTKALLKVRLLIMLIKPFALSLSAIFFASVYMCIRSMYKYFVDVLGLLLFNFEQ